MNLFRKPVLAIAGRPAVERFVARLHALDSRGALRMGGWAP